MAVLPAGTVTFLFTDVEGSTRLLQALGDGYGPVATAHRTLLRDAFQAHAGAEIDTQGDALFVAFPRARDAVEGAVAAQRALAAHAWPDGVEVRVRMGLHTGEPSVGDEGYVGLDVVRAARICAAAHGGQILVSDATRALLGAALPDGVEARDLGELHLKDLEHPERVFQLTAAGLPSEFPPPRVAASHLPAALPSDDLGARINAYVERHVERALTGEPDELDVGLLTKLTAFGLVSLLGFALVVVAIVLLVRAAFF